MLSDTNPDFFPVSEENFVKIDCLHQTVWNVRKSSFFPSHIRLLEVNISTSDSRDTAVIHSYRSSTALHAKLPDQS